MVLFSISKALHIYFLSNGDSPQPEPATNTSYLSISETISSVSSLSTISASEYVKATASGTLADIKFHTDLSTSIFTKPTPIFSAPIALKSAAPGMSFEPEKNKTFPLKYLCPAISFAFIIIFTSEPSKSMAFGLKPSCAKAGSPMSARKSFPFLDKPSFLK